jgi:CRP/FNR family cyclic AMP-dependent transcriptional regulator
MDAAQLKKFRLLSGMDDEMLGVLSRHLTKRRFKSDSLIFIEKMEGESLFLIDGGRVSLTKMVTEGTEKRLLELGPGDSFGELAVIDGGARAVTARVAEDADLLVLSREGFAALSRERPDVALVLAVALLSHIAALVRRHAPLMAQSLRETP